MTTIHTITQPTAASGGVMVGASWLGSGIQPGLVVVDSSRRRIGGLDLAVNPATHGDVANVLFAPAFTGC